MLWDGKSLACNFVCRENWRKKTPETSLKWAAQLHFSPFILHSTKSFRLCFLSSSLLFSFLLNQHVGLSDRRTIFAAHHFDSSQTILIEIAWNNAKIVNNMKKKTAHQLKLLHGVQLTISCLTFISVHLFPSHMEFGYVKTTERKSAVFIYIRLHVIL